MRATIKRPSPMMQLKIPQRLCLRFFTVAPFSRGNGGAIALCSRVATRLIRPLLLECSNKEQWPCYRTRNGF